MQIKKLFAALLIVLLAVSCKEENIANNNIFKFRDYISYTTSGLTSVADPIKIILANEVEGWEIGKELDSDLVKTKPHVQGKLQALDKTTLLFTPDENLDSATEYSVTVNIGDVIKDISSEYASYTFQFKTITPGFSINTSNLQSYSKEKQYLLAQLRSADVISLENAKKIVSASQNNKDLKLVWNEANPTSKYFEFKIDNITRFVEDSKIDVKWDGKSIGAENKGNNSVTIPGKDNFTIIETEVFQSPEQYLSINFSDPLKKQQNFKGLVRLEKSKNPKYVVDGNVLKVYPSSKLVGDIKVEIFTGIKNTDGYKLKKNFSENLTFESLKPEVKLLSNGAILPNSNDLKFNFEAVNLSKVDVRIIKIFEDNVLQFLQSNNLNSNDRYSIRNVGRSIAKETVTLIADKSLNTGKWKAYSLDLSKYFKADPGAIYRVELSFKRDYSLYDCEANSTTSSDEEDYDYYDDDYYASTDLSEEDQNLLEERYWDNLTYSYRNSNYRWRDRDNPCTDSYYNYQNRIVTQNLIGSNLGIIVKKGSDNKYIFAVTDILSTKPENSASVKLYNYQQQEIAKATTNGDGTAEIETKKNAAFAIVSKGENTSYVKLLDGNSLSLSKFDVSGKRLQRGLKGYIYGERGVWRPGDSLFLTFVLNDNANKLPKRHPVKLEITDPVGKLVYHNVTVDNVNQFYDFKGAKKSQIILRSQKKSSKLCLRRL